MSYSPCIHLNNTLFIFNTMLILFDGLFVNYDIDNPFVSINNQTMLCLYVLFKSIQSQIQYQILLHHHLTMDVIIYP